MLPIAFFLYPVFAIAKLFVIRCCVYVIAAAGKSKGVTSFRRARMIALAPAARLLASELARNRLVARPRSHARQPDIRLFSICAACCFEQEPRTSFRFIDPNFDQTRSSDVTMLIADVVRFAEPRGQRPVVVS